MSLSLASRALVAPLLIAGLMVARASRAQTTPPSDTPPPSEAPPPPLEDPPPPPPALDVAPPTEPTPPPGPPTTSGPAANEPEHPYGGYDGGNKGPVYYKGSRLWIRDREWLEVSPSALMQFDTYAYAGRGIQHYQRPDGTGLKTGLAARRIRLELSGRIVHSWFFQVGIESASGRTVVPLNNFVGYEASQMLRIQVGQFRIPFGMENSTGIRFTDFMERSMTSRFLGAPSVRDLGIMIWGGTQRSALNYGVGYFGGDGQNRASTDNRGDIVGRLTFRPLWNHKGSIGQAHIGVSGRYGRRDRTYVFYDANALSTPGGYEMWSPIYGTGTGETHILPSSDQSAIAAELFLPLGRFDLRGEVVYTREGRREVFGSNLTGNAPADTKNNTERSGTFGGVGYYVQAAYWFFGRPRIGGVPGNFGFPVLPPEISLAESRALQVAVRWEQIFARYDSTDRSFDADGKLISGVRVGERDATTTHIKINAFQVAASYWATRHIRLIAEWSIYTFPGTANQVAAPGTKPTANDSSAKSMHEFSMRAQLSL